MPQPSTHSRTLLLGRRASQRQDEFTGLDSDRIGHVEEFQHVKAPVATLVLGNIGRWLSESIGHYRLCQSGRLPRSGQQRAQLFVTLGVDRLGQLGSQNVKGIPSNFPLANSPKLGETQSYREG